MKQTIEFEGKLYVLKFKIKAIKLLRKHWDCSLMGLMTKFTDEDFTEDDLPVLLYAGMSHDHKEITLEKAEEIFDECKLGFVQLFQLIITAFMGSFPKGEEEKEDKKSKTSKEKN